MQDIQFIHMHYWDKLACVGSGESRRVRHLSKLLRSTDFYADYGRRCALLKNKSLYCVCIVCIAVCIVCIAVCIVCIAVCIAVCIVCIAVCIVECIALLAVPATVGGAV